MNGLRTQITLLLMAALILISILSMLATIVVYGSSFNPEPRYVYHVQNTSDPSVKPIVTVSAVPSKWEPDMTILLVYASLIVILSSVVSVIVGNMVVRPLKTIETAIDNVDPQVLMPELEEQGDGSALFTVKLLNRLSEALRKAMDSRMRLVAAAGHDLRTPLTRMRLRAEMVEDDKTRAKWINDIDEMMHIADSAISLVKEESGTSSKSAIRLDRMVNEIVGELEIIGHHVDIGRLSKVTISGGPLAIKRALTNLLVNACTHGMHPTISVTSKDESVFCVIEDQGPGIPEDLIQNAFEPFFRVDPSRRKASSGAGLGLAIVKEIVTRHGGTITLSNLKPTGLKQEIVFPIITNEKSA